MRKTVSIVAFLCSLAINVAAQGMLGQSQNNFNQIDEAGNMTTANQRRQQGDSLGTDKEIPIGLKVWTVDSRFGDRTPAEPDTIPHMFMNTIFTDGLYGQFNTTGNTGSPRVNRIFADRPEAAQFIFTQPYDFFIVPSDKFLFTNTLSPFTNLSYNTAGSGPTGEDHFKAKFGVNAGKRIGVGFNFDYIYSRGYYQNQSTSHFNYSMYGSYMGERYQAHLLFSTNNEKVAENGGIANDGYISHPEMFNESFATNEIPTILSKNWNRNNNQHVFFTQRYSLGFNRKVKMTDDEIKAKKFAIQAQKDEEQRQARSQARKDAMGAGVEFNEDEFDSQRTFAGRPDDAKVIGTEPALTAAADSGRIAINSKAVADSLLTLKDTTSVDTSWLKNEYVPVTSFIHTLKFDDYNRIYEAYATPGDFYANNYGNVGKFTGDSIFDKTRFYHIQNTFAISLMEGFNKWAKAGLKAFITNDIRHFTLPDDNWGITSYNENDISVGGELSKTEGKTLHYKAIGEVWLVGDNAGQLKIDASVDVNFPIFGDTMTLAASGFLHNTTPTFYYRHYHAKHLWWDNTDLGKIMHSRIQGLLKYRKTRTTLRFAVDEIKNYTYFGQSYTINEDYSHTENTVSVQQTGSPISLITASLNQDFTLGILNWENQITYQKSTNADALPVPDINIYTNLFLRFKIAHVLSCDFGADLRYYTKFYAPDYSPALGQFTTQMGDSKVKIGGFPLINIYANFDLKHTRFFIMMSHVNNGMGNKATFTSPHYPINGRVIRFGLSWNFFD